MEDKIDLDAIISDELMISIKDIKLGQIDLMFDQAKRCMKEAIHQSLVLASENATVDISEGGSDIGVDKQSILDIEKLIV